MVLSSAWFHSPAGVIGGTAGNGNTADGPRVGDTLVGGVVRDTLVGDVDELHILVAAHFFRNTSLAARAHGFPPKDLPPLSMTRLRP